MVRLARELGLARFGKLSIDGTKVRANASKRKAMSYGRIAKEERRLRGEIEALLAAAGAADAAEDARLGSGRAGRRVAGGVAPPGRPSGGDPGGEVAVGGAAAGSGRRPRSAAGPRPEPEGRAALHAVVWRAGR